MGHFRFRNVGIVLFILALFTVALLTDPDAGIITNLAFGAGLVSHLVTLLLATSGAILLYVIRKVFFDYPEADIRLLLAKAMQDPKGAGLAVIGLGINMLAFAIVILAVLF